MLPLRSSLPCLMFVALGISAPVQVQISLSGTVLDRSNKPLPGVEVSLAVAGAATITDATGAWSLSPVPTGVHGRPGKTFLSGRITLEDRRVRAHFKGHDLMGRGFAMVQVAEKCSGIPARASIVQDTLLYRLNGTVRLRDTVAWLATTEIVRVLDTTFNPGIVYGYLTDSRDGQTYRTVRIGSQVWMAENLNFTPVSSGDSSWCYLGLASNCATYGRLYSWATAMGVSQGYNKATWGGNATKRQGLCPAQWHVPDDAEWMAMSNAIGSSTSAGVRLKSAHGWIGSNSGTDAYGMRMLPGGYYGYNGASVGGFDLLGYDAVFWSASAYSEASAWYRRISIGYTYMDRSVNHKMTGYSLRCVKD